MVATMRVTRCSKLTKPLGVGTTRSVLVELGKQVKCIKLTAESQRCFEWGVGRAALTEELCDWMWAKARLELSLCASKRQVR